MASNVASRRLLILGGSGYVGQNVCHAAVTSGRFEVVRCLGRSGAPRPDSVPPHLAPSLSSVEWSAGDALDFADPSGRLYDDVMSDVDAVVSCVGAFGSNETMLRMCGDATAAAVRRAAEGGGRGVRAFGFVSSARVYDGSAALRLPGWAPMRGYYEGKRRAEEEIVRRFPTGHVILRPGFVHGPRRVRGRTVPLQWIGGPIEFAATRMGHASALLRAVPLVGEEASSVVPVGSVAWAMVGSILAVTDGAGAGGTGAILDAASIREFRCEG